MIIFIICFVIFMVGIACNGILSYINEHRKDY